MEDILIGFGSELKLLPNGHIGGHLVRFSDKSSPDLAGDYFDADTDFGFEGEIKSPVFLNHRLPLETEDGKQVIVKKRIGEATLTKGDDGILIDAILYERKKYAKALAEMGWSSGTARHLADRTKTAKSYHVDFWQLGADASITPTPCDPGNVCTLKSYAGQSVKTALSLDEISEQGQRKGSLATYLNQLIDDRVDDGQPRDAILKSLARAAALDYERVNAILDGSTPRPPDAHLKAIARVLNVEFTMLRETAHGISPQTIKGIFEEALADRPPSRWELDSAFCDVVRKLANVATSTVLTGVEFDLAGKVSEAVAEYMTRLRSLVIAQIEEYVQSGSDEPFYLKAIIDLDSPSLVNLSLEDQSQLVVSALRDVVKRYRANHEARQRGDTNHKAGRVLSEKNRARVSAIMEQMSGLVSDCQKLLDESMPMASASQKLAVLMAIERRKHLAHKLGISAN